MGTARSLKIRLVRSPIGFARRQKDTVRSLGFTRLRQVRTLPDNPSVRGMIASVGHLVEVLGEDGSPVAGGKG